MNESDAAVLLCSTSGNPAPTLVCSRINETLPSNRTKVLSNGVIKIAGVQLVDAGKYKCVAQNVLGRDEKFASIIVQSEFTQSLIHFIVVNTLLSCTFNRPQ